MTESVAVEDVQAQSLDMGDVFYLEQDDQGRGVGDRYEFLSFDGRKVLYRPEGQGADSNALISKNTIVYREVWT